MIALMTFKWLAYSPHDRDEWNHFMKTAEGACFLFDRNYLEYHSSRFEDFSHLCRREDGAIVAALPCNRRENKVYSHQGLTFGGFCFAEQTSFRLKQDVFLSCIELLNEKEIGELILKPLPPAFGGHSDASPDYLAISHGAQLFRMDLGAVIKKSVEPNVQERRIRGMKKALKAGVVVGKSNQFREYWNGVLIPTLQARHGASPTHSLDEILLLASRFPAQIQLWTALAGEEVIAGALTYQYRDCLHAQYIASSPKGRDVHALDGVFFELISEAKRRGCAFSFGISTEAEGTVVNQGLLEWKTSFGAFPYGHPHYKLLLNNSK